MSDEFGEWVETTVGQWCPFSYGKALPARFRHPGQIPVYGSNGIVGSHDEALVDGPGVVIGRKGTVGAVHYSSVPFWPIDTTFFIKAATHRDTYFAGALLSSLGLESRNSHSAVPGLSREDAHGIQILVPPLAEQNRIALILHAIDKKAESCLQIGRLAVNAILSLYDIALNDAGTGLRSMSIVDAIKFVGGGTPSTAVKHYWDPPVHPWATPRDLSRMLLPMLIDTERRISTEGLGRISSRLLPSGSLLMSSRAPIGYLAWTAEPTAINQGFIAMLPGETVSTSFMFAWCQRKMEKIKARAGGTTFQEINRTAFGGMDINLPSAEILADFDSKASPLRMLIERQVRELASLRELRSFLLPALVSGDLQAREVHPEIELAS